MGKLKDFLKGTSAWIRLSYSLPYQRIRMPENYERLMRERAFYQSLFKNLDRKLVFDVGANVGHKSDTFRRMVNQVIAFEPSAACRHILKSRFWGFPVHIIDVALGSKEGQMDFYDIDHNTAYSSLSEKHIQTTVKEREVADMTTVNKQKVRVDTLDNYIKKFGVPCYIKIDVEGYEIEVLKGLTTLVPLISYEANLPEFKEEAIEGIQYLIKIGGGRYSFNFAEDTAFLFDAPVDSDRALQFLRDTSLRYLEVYAWS